MVGRASSIFVELFKWTLGVLRISGVGDRRWFMCDSLRDSSRLVPAVRTPVPSLESAILAFVCWFHILQLAVFVFSSRFLL